MLPTWIGTALALLCTLLFAAAALIGLRRLLTAPPPPQGNNQPSNPKGQRRAFVGALAWGCGVLALLCLAALAQNPGAAPLEAVRDSLCGSLDARHYLDLARWGYGAAETGFPEQYLMIVFFPLWPWLLRPFALLGIDLWLAGTVLALLLTAAGTRLLYRCAWRLLGSGRAAGFACAVQLLLPGSFFLVLPQTEALFYCLNFAFLDAMQQNRPGRAGVFGLLAALCRANGVLLAGYALLWMVGAVRRRQPFAPAWLAAAAGPVAGLGVYLGLNWAVYGNAVQFSIYQQQHWSHSFCLFPRTVQIMSGYIGTDDTGLFLGLWTVVLILLEVLLLALVSGRLDPGWLLLGLAGVAMMNGQTWLISAQRYALGMPALAPSLALVTGGRRRVCMALAGVLAVLWGIYLASFVRHAPIY